MGVFIVVATALQGAAVLLGAPFGAFLVVLSILELRMNLIADQDGVLVRNRITGFRSSWAQVTHLDVEELDWPQRGSQLVVVLQDGVERSVAASRRGNLLGRGVETDPVSLMRTLREMRLASMNPNERGNDHSPTCDGI